MAAISQEDTDTDHNNILISCTDDFDLWAHFESQLLPHLPLRNVAWNNGEITQNIPCFSLEFVPANSPSINSSAHPVAWGKRPFLYIFVAKCEDMDHYKVHLKEKLKVWLTTIQEKQAEWLVLYLPLGTSSSRFESSSKTYRKIFDKIKGDFKIPEHRLLKYDLMSNDKDHSDERHARKVSEVLTRVKELTLVSLAARLEEYEQELVKVHTNRKVPGWNFCNFVVIKETMGLIYERLGLLSSALKLYDELVAYIGDNVLGNKLCSFERFGGTDAGDDTCAILDTSRKPFRHLTYTSAISELDCRSYLFARQCQLLLLMNRPIDAAVRALSFIPNLFDEMLSRRRQLGSMPALFPSSWALNASRSLAETLRSLPLMHMPSNDPAEIGSRRELCRLQAELVLYARRRLVAFGSVVGDEVDSVEGEHDDKGIPRAHAGDSLLTSPRMDDDEPMPPRVSLDEITPEKNEKIRRGSVGEGRGRMESVKQAIMSGVTGTSTSQPDDGTTLISEDLNTPFPPQTPKQLKGSALSFFRNDVPSMMFTFRDNESPMLSRAEVAKHTAAAVPGPAGMLPELVIALKSRGAFERLLMDLTVTAAAGLQRAKRGRAANMIMLDAAAVHISRERYAVAQQILQDCVRQLSIDGWSPLLVTPHEMLAKCFLSCKAHDKYSETCVRLLSPALNLSPERREIVTADLVKAATSLLEESCTQDVSHIADVSLHFRRIQSEAAAKDAATGVHVACRAGAPLRSLYTVGATVDIHIHFKSHLPIDVAFDKIVFQMMRAGNISGAAAGSGSRVGGPDSLLFEEGSFTIKPGKNKIILSHKVASVGEFVPESLYFEIGKLRLAQSLATGYENMTLLVEAGHPAAEIRLSDPRRFVIGHRSHVRIDIESRSDAFRTATLRLKSASGLKFGSKCKVKVSNVEEGGVLEDGEEAKHTLELSDEGWVSLPSVRAHRLLRLCFVTDSVPVAEDGAHRIQGFFEYTRLTAERFSKTLMESVEAVTPFRPSHVCSSYDDKLFVNIKLESNSDERMAVRAQNLTAPAPFTVVSQPTLEPSLSLGPGQKVGLTYVLAVNTNDFTMEPAGVAQAATELTLDVQYCPKSACEHSRKATDDNTILDFTYKVPVDLPRQPILEVASSVAATCSMGRPTAMTITVKSLPASPSPSVAVRVRVDCDSAQWLVSGEVNTPLTVTSEGVVLRLFLVPVVAGYLGLPQVTIIGVPATQVRHTTRASRSLCMPPNSFTSGCIHDGNENDDNSAEVPASVH